MAGPINHKIDANNLIFISNVSDSTYSITEDESKVNKVENLLKEHKRKGAESQAKGIRNPDFREASFTQLINYDLEQDDLNSAINCLDEIKDPKFYDDIASKIYKKFTEIKNPDSNIINFNIIKLIDKFKKSEDRNSAIEYINFNIFYS